MTVNRSPRDVHSCLVLRWCKAASPLWVNEGRCGLGMLRWVPLLVDPFSVSNSAYFFLALKCRKLFNKLSISALKNWQSCNASSACHLDQCFRCLTTLRFNHSVYIVSFANSWHPKSQQLTPPWPLWQVFGLHWQVVNLISTISCFQRRHFGSLCPCKTRHR